MTRVIGVFFLSDSIKLTITVIELSKKISLNLWKGKQPIGTQLQKTSVSVSSFKNPIGDQTSFSIRINQNKGVSQRLGTLVGRQQQHRHGTKLPYLCETPLFHYFSHLTRSIVVVSDSVFFIENSERESLFPLALCSLESAALHNPSKAVYMLRSSVGPTLWVRYFLGDCGVSKQFVFAQQWPNLSFWFKLGFFQRSN